MKLRMLIASCAVAAGVAACGGAAGPEPTQPSATAAPSGTPSPAPGNGIAQGQVLRGKALRSSDGSLEVAGTGTTAVDVTVRELGSGAPTAPRGWTLVGRVYEITATATESGQALAKLADPFELRFRTDGPLATVMYFDGSAWQILVSDLERGTVVAETDHLSAFALARPSTTHSATATPSATPTPPAVTPSGATPTRAPGTPVAGAATTVSPEVAAAALQEAIEKWRGAAARANGAADFEGRARMELPEPVAVALETAGALGDLYAGVYNGVNEAFVAPPSPGGTAGTFALLIEPKLEFPASSSQAQRMLAGYFPGATGTLFVPVTQSPTMYTYQATNSSGFIVLGFIEHEGVALAFMSVGSGGYVGAAVEAKD